MFCRVRPPIAEDGSGQGSTCVVHPDQDDDSRLLVDFKNREQNFGFDRVFGAESTQDEVNPYFNLFLILNLFNFFSSGFPRSPSPGHFLHRRFQRLHLCVRSDRIGKDAHHARSLARTGDKPTSAQRAVYRHG